MFFLTLKNSVWFEDLDRGKVIYKYEFDPFRLDERELLWLIKAYKELKQRVKSKDKNVVDNFIELYKEIEKIIDKGSKGNGKLANPLLFDPSLRAVTGLLVWNHHSKDVGVWWCNRTNAGKYFTDTLCDDPFIDYHARAVAVNPWSIPNWADLDTVMGECGNKSGSIGNPQSYTHAYSAKRASYTGTFNAVADTKVYSVLFLGCTGEPNYSSSCSTTCASPLGTCNDSYYETVYLPLWGWNVEVDVLNGVTYSVHVVFESVY